MWVGTWEEGVMGVGGSNRYPATDTQRLQLHAKQVTTPVTTTTQDEANI